LALIVDPEGEAHRLSVECAKVLHTVFFGPEEGVMSCVAEQVGLTDHLTLVIDVGRNVATRAAKVAEVNHSTVWPLWPEHGTNNISSRAPAHADRLALVVDCVRKRVRVAGKRRELLDLAFFPDRSLNLQKEERARVWRGSLCSPHYLTSVVYPQGLAVVTA